MATPMTSTPLILSADDYAQGEAIDHGILNLIHTERLTATSCLTLSPRWPEAAAALTPDIRQQADIGLHLDFTQFSRPVRHPHPRLVMHSLLRLLDEQQVRATIALQLDAFEQAMGSAPDYVDGHQHVHQLPQIRNALLAELQSRYAGKLPWIRISHPAHDGWKGRVISALGSSAIRKQAATCGFSLTDGLLGVYGFDRTTEDYLVQLRRWLEIAVDQARQGHMSALMCHPGLASADASDTIKQARQVEYEVLAGLAFAELIQKLNIQLVKGSCIFPQS